MTQVLIDRATLELVLRTLNRLRYDNDSAMAEEGFHEAAEALRAALANAETAGWQTRAEKANAKKLAEKAMLEEIDAKHGCTDIAELGLPENVANPMRASGIHTIQRALVRGENEWLKTANFGRKSLSLLRESLSKYKAT